ncbi:MAG: hypothetical protein NTV05_17125 [Acidobacteria bacterium]|nr:hypothetical protein [Acidobacteriota bacterium]
MIHRASRDRLAERLRHYVSGRITNDDLDEVEVDWRDRGAVAVKQMAWQLYDDTKNHFVEGRLPRGSVGRRTVSRWIAFLYSNEEYFWPEYSFIRIVNWPLNLVTFGWWERMKRRKWEEFLEAGDFEAWPFCRKDVLRVIVREPRLLAGRGRTTDPVRGEGR